MIYFIDKRTKKSVIGYEPGVGVFEFEMIEIAVPMGEIVDYPVYVNTGAKPGAILREHAKKFKKTKSIETENADDYKATTDLIEARINSGMKPKQIAEEMNVKVDRVYQAKFAMKQEGRLHVTAKITKELEEEIIVMAAEHKNAIEIASELGLQIEDVQAIIKNNL